jgi:hypothetical protein
LQPRITKPSTFRNLIHDKRPKWESTFPVIRGQSEQICDPLRFSRRPNRSCREEKADDDTEGI